MFGSSMLDIAIGVVFIYLLLSVFATALNEVVVSALSLRGKYLLQGIKTLLNDNTLKGFAKDVYEHGQIYGLYDGPFDPGKPKNLPSYIPSRNFALALISCVEHRGAAALPLPHIKAESAEAEYLDIQAHVEPEHNPTPLTSPTQPVDHATAATQAATAVHSVVLVSELFRDAAADLAKHPQTEKIGKPLVAMIESGGGELAKLQAGIENWYNSAMDRVSGKYKFYTQRYLLLIGLIIAISLNADTINIVRHLSKDSALRQSIVAAAQTQTQTQKDTQQSSGDSAKAASTAKADGGLADRIASANTSLAHINSLGLPIGWPIDPQPSGFWQYVSLMLGWIFTAIAISLGAPFWFDALNKIMVVRSTVKPSEKSPDEKPKN